MGAWLLVRWAIPSLPEASQKFLNCTWLCLSILLYSKVKGLLVRFVINLSGLSLSVFSLQSYRAMVENFNAEYVSLHVRKRWGEMTVPCCGGCVVQEFCRPYGNLLQRCFVCVSRPGIGFGDFGSFTSLSEIASPKLFWFLSNWSGGFVHTHIEVLFATAFSI